MALIDPKTMRTLTKIGVENRKLGRVSKHAALMAGTFGTKAKTGRTPIMPKAAQELALQAMSEAKPLTRQQKRSLDRKGK